MIAIDVKNLTVKYKDFIAVNDLSFSVKKGEIFGIIGPNGAGKTSTLECIEGLRKITSGEIKVFDIDHYNRTMLYTKLGVQLQETKLQDNLKVIELIKLYSSFYQEIYDYHKLLEMFDLQNHKHFYVRKLSGGQKQKLAIILALIGNPEVLIVDEISTGLDPNGRLQIWNTIKDLQKNGKTILLTTQYMEEAEYLCDRICMIVNGKIKAMGTLNELIKKAELPIKISLCSKEKKKINLVVNAPEKIIPMIKQYSDKMDIIDIDIKKPSLEDVFFKLTGSRLDKI